jgi:hypothetical protein
MTVAFVLGNGQSRASINLVQLKQLGPIYGCNGLYRDWEPDCLVATDRPIAEAIQRSGYSKKHRFYTRKPLPDSGAQVVPRKYHGNSSGPIACALAALDGHTRIYMLGFDMAPSPSMRFNNVYAGTEFYKSPDAAPTFTGNWIRQLITMAGDFPKTKFIRVCGPTSAEIKEFKTIENFDTIDIKLFSYRQDTNDGL